MVVVPLSSIVSFTPHCQIKKLPLNPVFKSSVLRRSVAACAPFPVTRNEVVCYIVAYATKSNVVSTMSKTAVEETFNFVGIIIRPSVACESAACGWCDFVAGMGRWHSNTDEVDNIVNIWNSLPNSIV